MEEKFSVGTPKKGNSYADLSKRIQELEDRIDNLFILVKSLMRTNNDQSK